MLSKVKPSYVYAVKQIGCNSKTGTEHLLSYQKISKNHLKVSLLRCEKC